MTHQSLFSHHFRFIGCVFIICVTFSLFFMFFLFFFIFFISFFSETHFHSLFYLFSHFFCYMVTIQTNTINIVRQFWKETYRWLSQYIQLLKKKQQYNKNISIYISTSSLKDKIYIYIYISLTKKKPKSWHLEFAI